MTSVYIHADDSTILKRLKSRGDDESEAVRRLNNDKIDFEAIENEADYIVYNNDANMNDVVTEIIEVLRY